jgi:hypothetical protein
MRILLVTACIFLLSPLTLGQASSGQDKDAKAKEELRKLFLDYNEAGSKRDRAALERLFAEDYVWVHATGGVRGRTKHINDIMGNEAQFSVPVPSPDQFLVYGDVAVLRVTGSGSRPFGTTIFAKRDGRWQFVQAQSTLLPPERKPIELDPKALDSFVGEYEFAPGAVATVTREGNTLMWQGGRRPKVRLLPLSETRFFGDGTDSEMTFRKGDKGQATHVTLRLGTCQESEAKRVE